MTICDPVVNVETVCEDLTVAKDEGHGRVVAGVVGLGQSYVVWTEQIGCAAV